METSRPVAGWCVCGRPSIRFTPSPDWHHCDPAWDQAHPVFLDKDRMTRLPEPVPEFKQEFTLDD